MQPFINIDLGGPAQPLLKVNHLLKYFRGGKGREVVRAVVDLPQPDSPTTPRVSPFITVKLISSTAWTTSRPLPPRKYFSR